jgi:hypothetical protein
MELEFTRNMKAAPLNFIPRNRLFFQNLVCARLVTQMFVVMEPIDLSLCSLKLFTETVQSQFNAVHNFSSYVSKT